MQYNPEDYPHPGEVLLLELEEIGLSQKAFAHFIQEDADLISDICSQKTAMTAVVALKTARALGSSPRKWLELQMNYDLVNTDKSLYENIRQLGSEPGEDEA